MRRKHSYRLAFLAVLLVALAGFALARRLIGPIEVPRLEGAAQVQAILGDIDVFSLIPRRSPQPRATPGEPVAPAGPVIIEPAVTAVPASVEVGALPSVSTEQGTVELPQAGPLAAAGLPTPSPPLPTPTAAPPLPTPTAALIDPGHQFVAAGQVRYGNSDCPGASIRGVVRDAGGVPLHGVRLWRYDQWGNEQVVETKTSDVDAGQYDFPVGDTPNVHYIQVIDSGGTIISPVIEIQHRQGEALDAACHWVDWVKRADQ